MEDSILTSTKKILGLDAAYTAFDLDIVTHINSAFAIVKQLGVGPTVAFTIEDETSKWEDFLNPVTQAEALNLVRTYVFLKVRLLFDPPATSFHLTAAKEQAEEYEWRINNIHETETPWEVSL